MMTPQQMNYFTALLDKLAEFLRQYADLEDLFQVGFDLEIDMALLEIDFADPPSELDHLTAESVGAAFQAFTAIQAQMNANDRQRWSDFLEILRQWNR